MEVEGRFYDRVRHRFGFGHGILGVLQHIKEELLIREVGLGGRAHIVHSDKNVKRVLTNRRLCVQEQTIRPINHRRVDIRDFSPGRKRIKNHGIEELGREDYRFRGVVAQFDDCFLHT